MPEQCISYVTNHTVCQNKGSIIRNKLTNFVTLKQIAYISPPSRTSKCLPHIHIRKKAV